MSTGTRRQRVRDLRPAFDVFDSVFPYGWRLPLGQNVPRIEEYTEDGNEVVRFELPGVDPDKDVTVSVAGGMLTIEGARVEPMTAPVRSEFRYGSFVRQVPLPAGADPTKVSASYDRGILTVRVPVSAEHKHEITIEH